MGTPGVTSSSREIGLDLDFVHDNHGRSSKHVLRGLHYQAGEAAQGRLVCVTSGTVFDVLVDLRKSSPTYGVWDGCMLTTDAHERPYVPPGCAHGFLVLSDIADFHYKVTTPYNPQSECALRWDDSVLAIDWPLEIGIELILSAKDRSAPGFKECVKSEWPRKNYPLTSCLAGGEHQTHQIGDDLRLRTSVQLAVVGKSYGRLRGLR